jgi:hypothetical protein
VEKLDVLAQRASRGEQLWHVDDAATGGADVPVNLDDIPSLARLESVREPHEYPSPFADS